MTAATPWERGRLDAAAGPRKVLFGRMYEDTAIELDAFRGKKRVFCIASAGCTAIALAAKHDVVAIDINPVQLAYAARRIEGAPRVRGTAEKVMAFGRGLAPILGWSRPSLEVFLELGDPEAQLAFWRTRLDTRRFRAAFDGLLSVTALRSFYASHFLDFLPKRLGVVLRARLERGFAKHPNRENPYARALFLGSLADLGPAPAKPAPIELVQGDAVAFLEAVPAGRFDAFTFSNILDGANPEFAQRLFAAAKRAAAPGAVAVLRSFAEPRADLETNRAADDRSMLWGVVDVRPMAEFD